MYEIGTYIGTCSVFGYWQGVKVKCLFIFVHFVGAEGLVIIQCPGTSYRYLPCWWYQVRLGQLHLFEFVEYKADHL